MISQTQFFAPSRFNHCSAIASHKEGTMLAFYSGPAECDPQQKVYIFFTDKTGKTHDPIYIEENTGNPVFLTHRVGLRLIYSKFEKFMPDRRVAQWQHCSLWIRDLYFDEKSNEIKISEPQPLDWNELDDEGNLTDMTGYLPRCNPITCATGYLLPLYRERQPHYHGVILHSEDGMKWTLQGKIGEELRCMQPTLWYQDGKVHALLRNYNFTGERYAYYSTSENNGKTWSEPTKSNFLNANNSILAIDIPNKEARRKEIVIVWNDDISGRSDITLGTTKGHPLTVIDGYGSYPSACITKNKIFIAYTAKADLLQFPYARTVIKVVQYDLNTTARAATKARNYPYRFFAR